MNNMNHHQKVLYLVHAALIAAVYVVLTELAAGFDLASGAIQVRFSEVLTVLPFFTGAAIPGVTIGCLLANILTGSALPDVIFGTLATLIGAVFTYQLRRHRFLCTLPPVISNAIIIPLVLRFAYATPGALWFLALTVGAGEVICCVIFGSLLISVLLPAETRSLETDQLQSAFLLNKSQRGITKRSSMPIAAPYASSFSTSPVSVASSSFCVSSGFTSCLSPKSSRRSCILSSKA